MLKLVESAWGVFVCMKVAGEGQYCSNIRGLEQRSYEME